MTAALDSTWKALASVMTGTAAINFPIGALTTYRLGGSAALYVEPEDQDDLMRAKPILAECGLEILVIGRGSNLLVSDRGFLGVAIRLGVGFNWMASSRGGASSGGATPLPNLARWCAERSLAGMEFAVGIPASVGGGVRMNAGGHGSEIAEVLESAMVCDIRGDDRTVARDEMQYAYRRSELGPTEIVVSAAFRLEPGSEDEIRLKMSEISRWRRENHPGGSPNAGSMFKNPAGDSAGRLIEGSGLKGMAVGGAHVAEKHANFILADPGTTAADVNRLMGLIRQKVAADYGVVLEPEVRRVGEFDDWPETEGAA